MKKICWTEHISNEEVLKLEEERSMLTTIRTRQRNWMGHIIRGDSLQREIIEGRMEGKRGRGRPRQKLLDWMMSEGSSTGSFLPSALFAVASLRAPYLGRCCSCSTPPTWVSLLPVSACHPTSMPTTLSFTRGGLHRQLHSSSSIEWR